MIIDVHYHVGTKVFGRWDFAIDKRWVKDEMQMSDVGKTIVFPYMSPGSYDELNTEILDVFADEDIIPFGRLRFNYKPGDALKYLSRININSVSKRSLRIIKEIIGRKDIPTFADEKEEKARFSAMMRRCKGIKFHDNQDGHLHEQHFEFLISFGKPIIIHINPYKLEYFLSIYKHSVKSPIVIAHLGAIDADSIYLTKTIEMLKKYDFLFTDTAGHVCANYVIPFLSEVPEKILFGSDGPVVSQGSTKCLLIQCGRELFKDKGKGLAIIEKNTVDFCNRSGWEM